MKSVKVLLGVLAGITAGAALGILFAPEKGSATRKKLLKKGGKYKVELEDKYNELIEDLVKKFESVKGKAGDLIENGKAKAQEFISK